MGDVRSVLIGATRCDDKCENTVLLKTQGPCGSARSCSDDTVTHEKSVQGNCQRYAEPDLPEQLANAAAMHTAADKGSMRRQQQRSSATLDKMELHAAAVLVEQTRSAASELPKMEH